MRRVGALTLVLAAVVPCLLCRDPCRKYSAMCTGKTSTDNCDISRYGGFKDFAAKSFLVGFKNPDKKSFMQTNWMNLNGSCYIEVVLNRLGRIMFIRFASTRSLMIGKSAGLPWRMLRSALKVYESRPKGMQVLMELDGTQVCPYAWTTTVRRPKFSIKFFARFARRSSVYNSPMQRYTMHNFKFVEGVTSFDDLQDMQPKSRGDGALISELMKDSQRIPLVLWIYKCPANTGFMDLPCNSEANVHLFLRQWINSSGLYNNDDDFYNAANWRYIFLSSDYALLILMTMASIYVAFHLTCLVGIGLGNACVKVDR